MRSKIWKVATELNTHFRNRDYYRYFKQLQYNKEINSQNNLKKHFQKNNLNYDKALAIVFSSNFVSAIFIILFKI